MRKLLLAYLLFAAIGALYFGALSQVGTDHEPLGEAVFHRLGAIAYGSGSLIDEAGAVSAYRLAPPVLWYFPALIVGMVSLHVCWRTTVPFARWLLVGMLATTGWLLRNNSLPWELESGVVAAGFLALGHAVRISPRFEIILATLPGWLIALAAVTGTAIACWNDQVDLRLSLLPRPPLALLASALIIISLGAIAKRLPANRITTRLAEATLLIFPIHMICFSIGDKIVGRLTSPSDDFVSTSLPYACLKSLLTVAVLTYAYPWFLALFPVFSARTRKRAGAHAPQPGHST